jgi:hypothetical protein
VPPLEDLAPELWPPRQPGSESVDVLPIGEAPAQRRGLALGLPVLQAARRQQYGP